MAWRSPPMPRNPIEDLHWRVGLLEENVLPLGFDEAVFIFDKIRHSVLRRGAELGYPLMWYRGAFECRPWRMRSSRRYHMVSCEGEWVGLYMCQREGSWHVKAFGRKDVLRAPILNPPVRELLDGEGFFEVQRFEKQASAALGWELLSEVGLLSGLSFADLLWVFPVVLRDSRWLPRLETHREEFMQTLPESLQRLKYILGDLRSSFYSRLLDKVLCEGTEVTSGVFYPSAAFFLHTPDPSEDEDGSLSSDGCESEPVRRTCDPRRPPRRNLSFDEHQAEIRRISDHVGELEQHDAELVPTLQHFLQLLRMRSQYG